MNRLFVLLLLLLLAGASFFTSTAQAQSGAAAEGLVNMSVRTVAGSGERTLIVGAVVDDGEAELLVRGIGPALREYGVNATLEDPALALYDGDQVVLSNEAWGQGTATANLFASLGAFPLAAGSRDAALVATVVGGRTVHLSELAGGDGVGLVEIYRAGGDGRLANFSARNEVGVGENVLVAGFVLEGARRTHLLVRAVGPGLAQYGVQDVLEDPVLTLFNEAGEAQQTNDNWGGGEALKQAFAQAAAFELADGGNDAAMLVTLPAGLYTAQVAGKSGATGVALVEVYALGQEISYGIQALAPVRATAPSIVSAPFRVVTPAGGPDREVGADAIEVYENGVRVGAEQFLRVESLGDLPYTFKTVLMLNVAGLDAPALAQLKQAALALVRQPVTGVSNLFPGQEVAVYAFDGTVREVVESTGNVALLETGIAGLTSGGSGSDLHGAIREGAQQWTRTYSPDGVEEGALIVVTHRGHETGATSLADATAALGGRALYLVTVGEGVNPTPLQPLTEPAGGWWSAEDFGSVQARLQEVAQRLPRERDPAGEFLVYYASAQRQGQHTLEVRVAENESAAADAVLRGTFDASGFVAATPTIKLEVPTTLYVGQQLEVPVETRWSSAAPNYEWATENPNQLRITAGPQGRTALINATGLAAPVAFTVRDLNQPALPAERRVLSIVSSAPARVRTQVAVASGEIIVRWDEVPVADYYNVFWIRPNAPASEEMRQRVDSGTSYTLPGLENGTPYIITVQSVVNGVTGPRSSAITARPAEPAPTLAWDVTLGGSGNETNAQVVAATGGGYLVGATSDSPVSGTKTAVARGGADYWVVKLAANGAVEWDRSFGGSGDDRLLAVRALPGGGYLLGGMSASGVSGNRTSAGAGPVDAWVVELDGTGNKVAERAHGGFGEVTGFVPLSDGGYLVLGRATVDSAEARVVRYDAAGAVVWDETKAGYTLTSAAPTADGGFVFGGLANAASAPAVMKTSAAGATQWAKTVDGAVNSPARVVELAQGGYAVARNAAAFADVGEHFLVDRLDAAGNSLWQKRLLTNGREAVATVSQAADGRILVGGSSTSGAVTDKHSPNVGEEDYWLVALALDGLKQWERNVGGFESDRLTAAVQTGDAGHVLAGESESGDAGDKTGPAAGGSDLWIVRLAPVPAP